LQKPGRNNDLFVLLYRASAFIRERRAQFRPSVRLNTMTSNIDCPSVCSSHVVSSKN